MRPIKYFFYSFALTVLVLIGMSRVRAAEPQVSLGVVMTQSSLLILSAHSASCPPKHRRAILVGIGAELVSYLGCWKVEKNRIELVYEDGDSGVIPLSTVTWKDGFDPNTVDL